MTGFKSIIRILIPAIAAALCSCIDSREEYWLHADGGGRAELCYHLPAAAADLHGGESGIRELIGDFIGKTPEITSFSCAVTTEHDRVRVDLRADFASALDLRKVASTETLPSAASNLAGEIDVNLHGRTLDFSRTISASKALPGLAFLPASQLAGHRMTYIMHLPSAPVDSNATRVEDGGRTLVWDIPLAQAIKAPLVTRFKMTVPIPWQILPVIGIPLSLVMCGLVFRRIRKSRNHFPGGNPGGSVL